MDDQIWIFKACSDYSVGKDWRWADKGKIGLARRFFLSSKQQMMVVRLRIMADGSKGGHLWEHLQDTFGGTWEFMWNGEKEEGIFIDTRISDLNIWVPFKWDRKYKQNNNRRGANGRLVGKWLEPCDDGQERQSRRSGTIILWSTVELFWRFLIELQCNVILA